MNVVTPPKKTATAHFTWDDPLLLDEVLTEDERMIRDSARQFCQERLLPRVQEAFRKEHFHREIMNEFGEMGFLGATLDSHGCAGVSYVSYGLMAREVERVDSGYRSAFSVQSSLVMFPIHAYGSEAQKDKYLPKLRTGEWVGCFGLTEPDAGSDAAGIRTTARRERDGWVINGSKNFISNAGTSISLGVTVLARIDDGSGDKKRYGAFFVESGTPGYELGSPMKKLGWHALDTRPLYFDDCFVSDDHVIGDVGDGLRNFLAILDPGRISVAALSLSLAAECLVMALDYAKNRQQFGRPLSAFQAVQHKLADMATEIEAARLLVYQAAARHDAGQDCRREAAMAKLYASEVANRVASQAVQIHGGLGYMRESRVARFYSDAKVLEIGEGTSEVQRNIIARLLGC